MCLHYTTRLFGFLKQVRNVYSRRATKNSRASCYYHEMDPESESSFTVSLPFCRRIGWTYALQQKFFLLRFKRYIISTLRFIFHFSSLPFVRLNILPLGFITYRHFRFSLSLSLLCSSFFLLTLTSFFLSVSSFHSFTFLILFLLHCSSSILSLHCTTSSFCS